LAFQKAFSKSDHFKVCCVTCIMLVDRLLTRSQADVAHRAFPSRVSLSAYSSTQRIVAFSILCELYRNEANGTNPFLPFFLDALENGNDPCERQYLVHLLCSPPTTRESTRKSARSIIDDFHAVQGANGGAAIEVRVPDLSALRRLYFERTPAVPSASCPALNSRFR
jgi:hypothetical protein